MAKKLSGNKQRWLTITTKGDAYIAIETPKPRLPTSSFRWLWSWMTKAETTAVMQNTSRTGIAIMAIFTCKKFYASQKPYISFSTYHLSNCASMRAHVKIVPVISAMYDAEHKWNGLYTTTQNHIHASNGLYIMAYKNVTIFNFSFFFPYFVWWLQKYFWLKKKLLTEVKNTWFLETKVPRMQVVLLSQGNYFLNNNYLSFFWNEVKIMKTLMHISGVLILIQNKVYVAIGNTFNTWREELRLRLKSLDDEFTFPLAEA